MPVDEKQPRWKRRREPGQARQHPRGVRVLTASAYQIDPNNRAEARRQRTLRQGWQLEAYNYRDAIPELRYALNFLANCSARMKVFPAAYPIQGEADSPISLEEAGAPQAIIDAAERAMKDLGNGRMAISAMLRTLSTNLSIAGEAYLLGQQNPVTGKDAWSIRSIDEIVIYDDSYYLREIPMDPQGQLGWIPLVEGQDVVTRLWLNHPRFRILADSACRSIIDDCEGLLILRRMIRATGRSRLAGRGILFLPNELQIINNNDDNGDIEADDFMAELTNAMIEPIGDEGVASSVVPIVVQGDGDAIAQAKWLDFAAAFDEMSIKNRAELVGIIATGLDLPKEMILGMADLNHWTAAQVDDNTFRYHVEPHVQDQMAVLTEGYFRPYMATVQGVNPADLSAWLDRLCLWYDPVDLVTHPDQSKDAFELHDRIAISDAALVRTVGFKEEDMPSQKEKEERMIRNQRTWPANVSLAIIGENDPSISIPPIETSGTIPGLEGGKVQGIPAPIAPAAPGAPGEPPAGSIPAPNPVASSDPTLPASPPGPTSVVAAGKPTPSAKAIRLSRKLGEIDRDLRARLQTALCAEMLRKLEKAGGRLRSRVSKDETLRTKIAHTKLDRVGATLGEQTVLATGYKTNDLMPDDWGTAKEQFFSWTSSAQSQALSIAAQIGGLEEGDPRLDAARATMARNLEASWKMLSSALLGLGHHLLYNPDPNVDPETTIAALNPDTVVPAGLIRAALGIAGGAREQDYGLLPTQSGAMVPAQPLGAVLGQVATGPTVSDLLSDVGAEQAQYEWVHGPALNPFEPHEALDGLEFNSFDDTDLANDSDFPSNAYFFPGDHAGCTCDTIPLWVTPEDLASVGVGPADSEE